MAKTRQFTIAVENRPGAVAEIARALGSAKVNILALLGTAQERKGSESYPSLVNGREVNLCDSIERWHLIT